MNQQQIYFLFKSKNFIELIDSHSIKKIIQILSFEDALRLAYNLLYNEKWDEKLQEHAIKLLYETRHIHQNRWNASWEYDALLGLACYIRYKHEESYEAYKRAFDKAENPPPRLLIELARCYICPGHPPISYDEAINLIMNALKEAPYTDGISLLCNIYSLKNDKEKEVYWNNILKKVDKNLNSPSIEPKFLVEEYLK